jgi:hypothetical protein
VHLSEFDTLSEAGLKPEMYLNLSLDSKLLAPMIMSHNMYRFN